MKLPLKNKDFTVEIDDDDFRVVGGLNWYCIKAGRGHRYAGWYFKDRDGKESLLLMHRVLFSLQHGDKMEVDHRDRNGLNNKRENIRLCEHKENMRNRKISKANKCGLKGVYASGNKWRAEIKFNGKKIHIGCFSTKEDAHDAYKKSASELHADFARFS